MRVVARLLFAGWGRKAAIAALLLALAAETFAGGWLTAPRLALFDLYERIHARLEHRTPAVIVAIDDQSLKRVGQWPWPRQTVAALLRTILSAHPAAVGFDMLFPEPDRTSPGEWVKFAGPMPPPLRTGIEKLPNHDRTFADVIASGPTVLGVGALRLEKPINDNGPLAPFLVSGAMPDWSPPVPQFNAALRSLPVLDNTASGHGVIHADPDPDGVFRRLPLVVSLNGRLAPAFSLELLRLVAGTSAIGLHVSNGDIDDVRLGPVTVPTQKDGSVWVHYSPHDDRRFVSAVDVLMGRITPDRFTQRIVLVSASGGSGLLDYRQTPVGVMTGTEIQAELIENILEGKLATRPRWAATAEFVLTLLFGLLLIVVLPDMKPRYQIFCALAVLAALVALGFSLWTQSLILVDAGTPSVGVAFVFVALTVGNFAESDLQRRRLRRELEERKLAEARTMGELEAGRRIQMGMLPAISSLDDPRVDLDARMIPARQVGGDLYDFFKIDDDRLFFAIGDVSGKGVPAALFMALAKSQLRSAALSGEASIAAIVNRTNRELARNNPEMLFITVFAGILDLRTGEMWFVNAGHDTPYLLRAGSGPKLLTAEGGPPLCTLDEFNYRAESCLIETGDILCLLTDGVTEAMTKDGTLMGRSRVEAAFSGLPRQATARLVSERIGEAVARFVAGAEASDDLTLLVIRLLGTF